MKLGKQIYKLRNFRYALGVSLLSAAIFVACSDKDDLAGAPDEPTLPEDYYYITLNVTTPTSPKSRAGEEEGGSNGEYSQTKPDGSSTGGDLNGVVKENALVSAHIYFCDEDYKVLASFESDYVDPVDANNNSFIRIKVENLDDLNGLVGKENVYLLIAGNEKVAEGSLYTPTNTNKTGDLSKSTFTASSLTGAVSPIGDFGNDGKYLPLVSSDVLELGKFKSVEASGMTAEQIIKSLFSRLTPTNAWWDINTKQTAVKLERGVARFEFRGVITPDATNGSEYTESFDYPVNGMNVKMRLASMTPFNVNTQSYTFRHTSEGTDDAWGGTLETVKMFGKENGKTTEFDGYNWVASPWWPTTPSVINAFSNTDKKYLIDNEAPSKAAGTKTIDELMSRTVSEPISQNGSKYVGGYHPWCYVMENTLYSQEMMRDDKISPLATGVAFKFMVLDKDGEPVKYEKHKDENALNPDSKFPLELEWSREADKEKYLEITDLKTNYWVQIAPDPVDGYYYLDYIAYIMHNYNSEGIGPMFFGVVRNNTYQISISKLAGLPNPNDPRQYFLELAINVLAWERRDVGWDF